MASMRKLNRRLLTWRRYAHRTSWNPRVSRPAWCSANGAIARGHARAWDAYNEERQRRLDREARLATAWQRCRQCGCTDERACFGGCSWVDVDLCSACVGGPADDRCCLAGDDGHSGPCVVACDECDGDGRCPECGGVDDLGCDFCDGFGSCPRGCSNGEVVLEEWTPAYRPVVTVDTGGLL